MLSQVTHSSKRLPKTKKHTNKPKQTGFQFLLQSLDRDKENHVPNTHTTLTAQMINSVEMEPINTVPIESFTFNKQFIKCGNNKGKFFLDNVKMLDNSDASQSQPNANKSNKNKKIKQKSIIKNLKNTAQFGLNSLRQSIETITRDKNIPHDMVNKLKHYLALTHDLLVSSKNPLEWKYNLQARNMAQDLISMIVNLEQQEHCGRKSLPIMASMKTTVLNASSVDPLGKGDDYVKIINSLQLQKEKLNSLISQHQMANIKMYIKLNQGESEQIEQCKKQLAMLFEKYKKLESMIGKQRKKMIQILKDKQALQKKDKQKTSQNQQMVQLIQKYQNALQKQKRQKQNLEKLLRQAQNSLSSRLSIHSRQESYHSRRNSSVQKDFNMQYQNPYEQDDKKFYDEMRSSSILTNTTRAKNKKGKIGINLNALFDNVSKQNISKLAQDPQRLTKVINQCKQTISKLQAVIIQQNKELELAVVSLQQMKRKLAQKDQNVWRLQSKITNLQKQIKAKSFQQSSNVQKKDQNSTKCKQKSKACRLQPGKVQIGIDFQKSKLEQYRIIAMQAQAIQSILTGHRIL